MEETEDPIWNALWLAGSFLYGILAAIVGILLFRIAWGLTGDQTFCSIGGISILLLVAVPFYALKRGHSSIPTLAVATIGATLAWVGFLMWAF